MANLSKVLYENAYTQTGVTVAYSGTELDGFNKENAIDYKDFSTFQPEVSATTDLDVTVAATRDIDCWSFFNQKTGSSGTFTMTLYYESAPSVFTQLDQVTLADGNLELREFSSVEVVSGRRIRVTFTTGANPFYVRQLMIGEVMEMERGQYSGVNPQTLVQGIVQSNNISENGSILGTNVKRIDVKSQIDLMYCTESWIRTTWNTFSNHCAVGRSFFYAWNPSQYPDEVVFCVASKINAPKNITPTPLMSVSMPIICRQPDL